MNFELSSNPKVEYPCIGLQYVVQIGFHLYSSTDASLMCYRYEFFH